MNHPSSKSKINGFKAILLSLGISVGQAPVMAAASEITNSIARLNYAGFLDRSHCTATLISQHAGITAKHCLRKKHTVLFGYANVTWVESRKTMKFKTNPDQDLAVICLSERSNQKPIKMAKQANLRKDMALSLYGYGASNPHILSEKSCQILQSSPKTYLNCPLEKGMSGGPAISLKDSTAKLVGVISATSDRYSIIEPLDDWVFSAIQSCD